VHHKVSGGLSRAGRKAHSKGPGAAMATSDFFEESKEQSVVKTTIVQKYFSAWAHA